jgi:hypothetical protein
LHINNTPPQRGLSLDARNHYPQIKHHTPPPKMERQPKPPHSRGATPPVSHTRDEEIAGLLSQSPIVCLMISRRRCFPTNSQTFVVAPEPHPLQARPISRIAQVTEPPQVVGGPMGLVVLLRKEVIQPHLPVRLPCYDFVPIADPTFDGSPPYGLGHRLRVLPTFMT